MNKQKRIRQIPHHAWIDEESYFYHLYKAREEGNPLYRKMAEVLHAALPDELRDALVDELMTAETRGELEKFRLDNHMEQIVDVFIKVATRLAVPMKSADGETYLSVPVEDLHLLKNAQAMNRLKR